MKEGDSMREVTQHLTDRTLIQLSDGELKPREESRAQQHLQACRQCRARSAELEATTGEYAQARELLPEKAAQPRAIFRARLAQLAAAEPARPGFFWRALPVAAALGVAVVAILVVSSGTVSAEGPKPKSGLTPGETRPVSLAEICAAPVSESTSDHEIPFETKRIVFSAYGMDPAQAAAYEVDYLITPELGGANTVRNLWPQPNSARWNARVKDKLEHRLHGLVCQGKVDLATAQHDISTDWISAYRKYVGSGTPQ
jgi:hypothetical protein